MDASEAERIEMNKQIFNEFDYEDQESLQYTDKQQLDSEYNLSESKLI